MTGWQRLILLGFAGTAAMAAPAQRTSPQTALDSVAPRPYAGTANCTFDRVLAGPSGTEVAVWPDPTRSIIGSLRFLPPTEVVVGRLHDPLQGSRDRLFSYFGGGLRLFPIRWSATADRLYVRVRENEQRVVAFTADGAPVAEVGPLDPSWSRVDLNAISHGDVAALSEPATVARTRRIDFGALLRGSATLGRRLELLAARRSDLSLVRVEATGEEELGINASQVDMLTAFPDDSDYRAGVGYFGAPVRGMSRYFPYQLPIVDLGSGRVAGVFGPSGLVLRAPARLRRPLDAFRRIQSERRLLLLDASYSAGALVLLTTSGSGDRKLFRLGSGGVSEQPLCAARATPLPPRVRPDILPMERTNTGPQPAIRAFAIDRAGREVMAPGRPILLRYSIGAVAERDAILYFHGGPGKTARDPADAEPRRLLAPGRDVISVDYTGSQGGGLDLTRRLAWIGIPAIEEDLDATVRWLRRQRYRRVFVVGVSFGGVPAMVAASRYPDFFSSIFFVTPLLRYRHPQEWAAVGTSMRGPVMPDTQLARDHAYYGGPAGRIRFAAQLQALVAGARLGQAHHFYFGAADPVSKPEDLPRGGGSPVHVRAGGHAWAIADPVVWEDVLRHIQQPPALEAEAADR